MDKVDWERRRKNLRLLIAYRGTNASQLARDAGFSVNTVTHFTSGRTATMSERTLSEILPLLGLRSPTDLDTDNPISDPMIGIKNVLENVPKEALPGLLAELKARFPAD